MIPKSWLLRQIPIDEFKALKRVDVIPLPMGYTKEDIIDKDKSVWWREPAFTGRMDYIAMMDEYQIGDEIWTYAMPMGRGMFGFNGSGLSGYALIRNGECLAHLITGA